jgi:hypothetical protein
LKTKYQPTKPTSTTTMPVTKKVTQRRSQNRSRGNQSRQNVEKYAGDAYDLASRTWKGLNEIRKFINIEEKYLDTSATHSPDQSGSVTCVSQLAQGTTMNTRIGNSIRVQRLTVRGRVAVNASATFTVVRVAVIRDMEGQGTAPTCGDIYETVGSSAAPRQPYDWLNRKRFALLYDSFLVLSTQDLCQEYVFDIDLTKHVLYRGTTAAAASDGEGSIYVVSLSDEATNVPTNAFTTRITFTDD